MKREQTVKSTDFAKGFGEIKNRAYESPLMITCYGRIEFVFMTRTQYEKLTRGKK